MSIPAGESGVLTAHDGLKLKHVTFGERPATALLILVHGYGDHVGRHEHFVNYMTGKGWVVRAIDMRGHGQSEGPVGHVYRFDDYLLDLDRFVRLVTEEDQDIPTFLVGHSQGGLIAIRYVLNYGADKLRGVVLSAPFLGLTMEIPALKAMAGRLMSSIWPTFSLPKGMVDEHLTHDEECLEHTYKDELYGRVATARWFTEMTAAREDTHRRAAEFRAPVLALFAGDDRIVSTESAKEFYGRIASEDRTSIDYEGLFHELLRERPKDREQVFGDISSWVEKRL